MKTGQSQVIEGRAEHCTLSYQVLAAAADKLVYRYDFGSDREHRIVLEAADFSQDDVNAGLARCP